VALSEVAMPFAHLSGYTLHNITGLKRTTVCLSRNLKLLLDNVWRHGLPFRLPTSFVRDLDSAEFQARVVLGAARFF
jgi:hypothetical protein